MLTIRPAKGGGFMLSKNSGCTQCFFNVIYSRMSKMSSLAASSCNLGHAVKTASTICCFIIGLCFIFI